MQFENKDFKSLKIRNFQQKFPEIYSHNAEVVWDSRAKRFLKREKQPGKKKENPEATKHELKTEIVANLNSHSTNRSF